MTTVSGPTDKTPTIEERLAVLENASPATAATAPKSNKMKLPSGWKAALISGDRYTVWKDVNSPSERHTFVTNKDSILATIKEIDKPAEAVVIDTVFEPEANMEFETS
jgi:hypothetical protein